MVTSTTFNITEYSSYLASCTAFLTTGIILLTFNAHRYTSLTEYRYPKFCVGITAITIGLAELCTAFLLASGIDYDVTTTFINPLIYFTQTYFTTSAILSMTGASQRKTDIKNMLTLPVAAIVIVYLVCYLLWKDSDLNIGAYELFTNTKTAVMMTLFFLTTVSACSGTYIYIIYKEMRRVKADNRDQKPTSRSINIKINTQVIITYLLALGAMIIYEGVMAKHLSHGANIVFIWINTVLFVSNGVIILNVSHRFMKSPDGNENANDGETELRHSKISLKQIEDLLIGNNSIGNSANTTSYSTENINSQNTDEGLHDTKQTLPNIEERVTAWKNLKSRPYCQEGLTLRDAAREMSLDPRLLSSFVNSMYKMNFNAWINTLRINEAKRLMRSQPSMTMVEIASRTGFTDSSAMSKIFKKQEGITPSQYRQDFMN